MRKGKQEKASRRPMSVGAIKTAEAEKTARAVIARLEDQDLELRTRELCLRSGSNITVSDPLGRQYVGWYINTFRDSLIFNLTSREWAELYNQVNLQGGRYTRVFQSRTAGAMELLFYAVTVRTPQGSDRW